MKMKTNINDLWKEYLVRGELKEEEMHQVQFQEIKRAFYGGFVSYLYLLNDISDRYSEDEAVKILDTIFPQINEFWENEVKNNISHT